MSKCKLALIARHDLHMRLGKALAQGGHGADAWLRDRILANLNADLVSTQQYTQFEVDWLRDKHTKIGLRADNEEHLLAIYEQAKAAGLKAYLITDSGLTEFDGPTNTVVGIGPDPVEEVDKITKALKLL